MWALLDFVARLICFGAFVLVGWWIWQIVREPSAARCLDCRRVLDSVSMVHCARCLEVDYV